MNLAREHNSQTLSLRERNEQLIHQWSFLLEQGRSELHLRQWFLAANYYQQAMSIAESLFAASLCKNCALRCYTRTLVEYAYVICKINGPESLELMEQAATLTLSAYVPMSLVEKLLFPITEIKTRSDADRELWLNQLFAEDASYKKRLH